MADCCPSTICDVPRLKRLRCPGNGRECLEVPARTIAHHIRESWHWQPSAAHYFICDDPGCDVVYFGDDGSVIDKSRLRTEVGLKATSDDGLLCYCFGIRKRDFLDHPSTRDFVVAQTRAGRCSCETSNPSGRCCLKDFPKPAPEGRLG